MARCAQEGRRCQREERRSRWHACSEGQACAGEPRGPLNKHWPTARRALCWNVGYIGKHTETPALRELASGWGSQIINSEYEAKRNYMDSWGVWESGGRVRIKSSG